jgi:type II secretory pathway component PulJ
MIELTIALAILALAGFAVWAFVDGSNRSWDTLRAESDMMDSLRRATRDIGDNMIQSAVSVITIDDTDPDWDKIAFQVPVQLSPAGIVWGADGNAGWTYRYEVRPEGGTDNLYRLTYDGANEMAAVILMRGIDGRNQNSKGLSFTLDTSSSPPRIAVDLRARRSVLKRGEFRRSLTMATIIKN